MARRKKASLGDALAELSEDFAVSMARTLLAKHFPNVGKFLDGMAEPEAEPKPKRTRKAKPNKDGVFTIKNGMDYIPPPGRRRT